MRALPIPSTHTRPHHHPQHPNTHHHHAPRHTQRRSRLARRCAPPARWAAAGAAAGAAAAAGTGAHHTHSHLRGRAGSAHAPAALRAPPLLALSLRAVAAQTFTLSIAHDAAPTSRSRRRYDERSRSRSRSRGRRHYSSRSRSPTRDHHRRHDRRRSYSRSPERWGNGSSSYSRHTPGFPLHVLAAMLGSTPNTAARPLACLLTRCHPLPLESATRGAAARHPRVDRCRPLIRRPAARVWCVRCVLGCGQAALAGPAPVRHTLDLLPLLQIAGTAAGAGAATATGSGAIRMSSAAAAAMSGSSGSTVCRSACPPPACSSR
jgi:hypothetical protein